MDIVTMSSVAGSIITGMHGEKEIERVREVPYGVC